jgi:hypothetical protein
MLSMQRAQSTLGKNKCSASSAQAAVNRYFASAVSTGCLHGAALAETHSQAGTLHQAQAHPVCK